MFQPKTQTQTFASLQLENPSDFSILSVGVLTAHSPSSNLSAALDGEELGENEEENHQPAGKHTLCRTSGTSGIPPPGLGLLSCTGFFSACMAGRLDGDGSGMGGLVLDLQ